MPFDTRMAPMVSSMTINGIAPGKVASQRADQHRANVLATHFRDARRAGESEHHDQPEQNLGQMVDGPQRAARGLIGFNSSCHRGYSLHAGWQQVQGHGSVADQMYR